VPIATAMPLPPIDPFSVVVFVWPKTSETAA
jgi:hypothetical protein